MALFSVSGIVFTILIKEAGMHCQAVYDAQTEANEEMKAMKPFVELTLGIGFYMGAVSHKEIPPELAKKLEGMTTKDDKST